MKAPDFGICVPVKVKKVLDGDTIRVQVINDDNLGLFEWDIRLLDCWAPEIRGDEREAGLKAKNYLSAMLEHAKEVRVFVPFVAGENILKKITTMGRTLGRLFIDGADVSELLVMNGYATKEKAK